MFRFLLVATQILYICSMTSFALLDLWQRAVSDLAFLRRVVFVSTIVVRCMEFEKGIALPERPKIAWMFASSTIVSVSRLFEPDVAFHSWSDFIFGFGGACWLCMFCLWPSWALRLS